MRLITLDEVYNEYFKRTHYTESKHIVKTALSFGEFVDVFKKNGWRII